MPYKLISGRPLAQEVRRLLDQQTVAAIAGLTHTSSADKVRGAHDTRKHVKKTRALLQLARRPLGKRYPEAVDELRTVNRALGPAADAHRVLETLAATRHEGILQLPEPAFSALRSELQSRASALDKDALVDAVQQRTGRLLKAVRLELSTVDLPGLDRTAVVAEIRAAHVASRKARRCASKHPSVASFHRWRRKVKREWHLLRLVSGITGDRLRHERHQLAALDACLGELHDVDVLMSLLNANSPLSRAKLSRILRRLRTHAHDLRHLARRLSSVLDERPGQLARRVGIFWGSHPRRSDAATTRAWQHSV